MFIAPEQPADNGKGLLKHKKWLEKLVGVEGVKPGMYVEPIATTVGSQDTTGPMTRDEIKELLHYLWC